ncbi:MAG: hypothetical protein H6509_15765 [Bryobacterales bacterium]|nr:hypothetical protein [Bryobacterales bacterium]
MSKEAFGVLRILEAHVRMEWPSKTRRGGEGTRRAEGKRCDGSAGDAQVPASEELRQQVRRLVFGLGLENWKDIPGEVDKYAGKHYVKV